MDRSDGDHAGVERRDVARDDRLQGGHEMRGDHDGVDRLVRRRAMPALADDPDPDPVDRRHRRPVDEPQLARRQPRPIVEPEHRVTGKAVEQAVRDHRARALTDLLRRLEDQMHGAGKCAMFREVAPGGKQDGGMAVMAAGMHPPHGRARVSKTARLLDRERIHIGADADRRGADTARQRADHAGAADPGCHVIAPFPEQFRDPSGGTMFVPGELGMTMQVVAQRDGIVDPRLDAIEHRHHVAPQFLNPAHAERRSAAGRAAL
jgi:hypothetical protein